MSQRDRYISGEISHDEYYGMIIDDKGFGAIRQLIPATKAQIIEALKTDKHLNNIPLHSWDRKFDLFRAIPSTQNMKEITGSTGWSLSDCVCTLKCAARRWAQQPD